VSDLEDWSPAEVLRAKRLEIVDDEGKVRAELGTDGQGVASLSLLPERQATGPKAARGCI
jgi:hypothetical protein